MAWSKAERDQVKTGDMCATDGCFNTKSSVVRKDGRDKEVCSDCEYGMTTEYHGWEHLRRIPSSRFL